MDKLSLEDKNCGGVINVQFDQNLKMSMEHIMEEDKSESSVDGDEGFGEDDKEEYES